MNRFCLLFYYTILEYEHNMIALLIILALSLTQATENDAGDKYKGLFEKYLNRIPDIEPKYIVNEDFSRVISKYLNGKISVFPLFKVSMKVDRNPVRIPWNNTRPENITGHKIIKMYKAPTVEESGEDDVIAVDDLPGVPASDLTEDPTKATE